MLPLPFPKNWKLLRCQLTVSLGRITMTWWHNKPKTKRIFTPNACRAVRFHCSSHVKGWETRVPGDERSMSVTCTPNIPSLNLTARVLFISRLPKGSRIVSQSPIFKGNLHVSFREYHGPRVDLFHEKTTWANSFHGQKFGHLKR